MDQMNCRNPFYLGHHILLNLNSNKANLKSTLKKTLKKDWIKCLSTPVRVTNIKHFISKLQAMSDTSFMLRKLNKLFLKVLQIFTTIPKYPVIEHCMNTDVLNKK